MRPTAILAIHAGVLAATLWLAVTAGLGTGGTAAAAILGAGPLLLAVRGLYRGARYTQQWAAIAMVFYIGVGLAETIATQARSAAAILLLFCSAAELLVLLRLLRSAPPAPRESAES